MGCNSSKSVTVARNSVLPEPSVSKPVKILKTNDLKSLENPESPKVITKTLKQVEGSAKFNLQPNDQTPRKTVDSFASEKPKLVNLLNSECTKEADLLLEAVSADENVSQKLSEPQQVLLKAVFKQNASDLTSNKNSKNSEVSLDNISQSSLCPETEIKTVSNRYLNAILTRDLIFMHNPEVRDQVKEIDENFEGTELVEKLIELMHEIERNHFYKLLHAMERNVNSPNMLPTDLVAPKYRFEKLKQKFCVLDAQRRHQLIMDYCSVCEIENVMDETGSTTSRANKYILNMCRLLLEISQIKSTEKFDTNEFETKNLEVLRKSQEFQRKLLLKMFEVESCKDNFVEYSVFEIFE